MHVNQHKQSTCQKSRRAYKTNNSGRAFLDKNITVEEDIIVLEELGRLALECTEFGGYGKSDRLALKAMELHPGNEKTSNV